MIAIVESSRDTRSTLLYNEQKLEEHKAVFLGAFNYCQEDQELSFESKLERLRDFTALNERSQAKTIHFSLNYDPAEQLDDRKMRRLAREFLQKIDFGDQPALVYRHLDAGHPHAHIVTVNIRRDGSRIENDKRAPLYMQTVCAGLEHKYGLRQSGMHEALSHWQEERQPALRLEYGKDPTKPGIQRVLDHILPAYNYTNLEELNAVLGLYRVQADRGSEFGLMYKSGGLYYRMLDDRGVKIGAPVKASAFKDHPTLPSLEERFQANRLTRDPHLENVKQKLDISMHFGDTSSLQTWRDSLRRDRVVVVIPRIPAKRKHAAIGEEPAAQKSNTPFDGHGFYYVDFDRKLVIRDTELGTEYSARSILLRTGLDKQLEGLAQNREVELKPRQQRLLGDSDTDPRQRLRALLDLSHQHDKIVSARLERQDDLRRQHRRRLRL